jgi:O-phosphoseryl-tRNA(Cys) synthetase
VLRVLSSDPNGERQQGTFNYPSVLGMCLYLAGHTSPDIAFAVSQCARFTHSHKRSHELALEQIGLYLKGTTDKGLILRPNLKPPLQLDCYVDSDFAGM